MDIRKFFGSPKNAAGSSKSKPTQNAGGSVQSKLSAFKKEEKEVSSGKANKSQKNEEKKSTKIADSKLKSRVDNDEEDIVIDDDSSSDEFEAKKSQKTSKKTSKDSSIQRKDRKLSEDRDKCSKSDGRKNGSITDPKKGGKIAEISRDKEEKLQKSHKKDKRAETDLKKEHKSEKIHKKEQSAKKPDLNKEESVRRSPRKASSDSNGKKLPDSKKKAKRVISDDESDEEVSIIKDTSSEDEEEVVTSIKRRNGGKRKRGRNVAKVLDSDSEDEDPVPKKTPQGKKKNTKSGTSFVLDSDEERKETTIDKFFGRASSAVKKEEPKKEVWSKKQEVNVMDFFGTGSASASRVDRPKKPVEKRKREEPKTLANDDDNIKMFEEEMHDDEDFMKVLDELDGPDVKKVKLSEPAKNDSKEEQPGSLASKLASKMKAGGTSTESVKPGKDINKNNLQTSPVKKETPSPSKTAVKSLPKSTTTITTTKNRGGYTLEVTRTKDKTATPSKAEQDKVTERTPPKTATPKSAKDGKKGDDDKEDDGFGTKKAGGFRAFKMRGGPLALGSKEIPEGAENCLEGLTFVITGVLDSIERDDAKTMVEKYGGKVTTSLSKKTSYLVVGREPGDSKLTKAKDLKLKVIDEDGLFDLVRSLPGKTSKYEIQAKEQLKKEESMKAEKEKSASIKKLESFKSDKDKPSNSSSSSTTSKPLFTKLKSSDEKPSVSSKMEDTTKPPTGVSSDGDEEVKKKKTEEESLLWVDKHRPTALKQIIGQQGDKSNAHKLLYWIRHWHHNVIVRGVKAAGNFFGKAGGDGTGFRAALLSGPPGIGKTTTATLVCKEAGFSYVELNASDTRSKKSLKEVIAESLNNRTLIDYLGDDKKSGAGGVGQHSQHHCLIMDEVDGMAGNEDRGGLQELVQLIKTTKIPIVCICNDRNSMKMRTLANHCFDLRFQRPRVEQIKGAMMTLAFREGVKIPPSAVQEIIQAANHDIRQVIHNLSMWSAGEKNLSFEQVKADAQKAQKDMKMGPFDVCRKVFVSDEETRKMSINDKSDLFFHDYSFAPLFVHENYPHVIPSRAEGSKWKHLSCLSHTMDSLCDGDLVEKLIRNGGNWNLLPVQAMYSSVLPGEFMRGSFPQMTNFPAWLGKNSSKGKTDRIIQELGMHMALKVSCDKRGLNQDYLPALRTCLTSPLASHGNDGVPGVVRMMEDYDIVKDDFDNILEVSKWPNTVDFMARVESKTKASLTRMYNKSGHMTPYSTATAAGKKKRGGGRGASTAGGEDELLKEEGEEEGAVMAESEEEEDDEPVAVATKPKGKSGKQNTTGSNRGKGKGKGRT